MTTSKVVSEHSCPACGRPFTTFCHLCGGVIVEGDHNKSLVWGSLICGSCFGSEAYWNLHREFVKDYTTWLKDQPGFSEKGRDATSVDIDKCP